MDRRNYLRNLTVAGLAMQAGCLGDKESVNSPHTYLDRPENQKADSADLAYLAWGQQLSKVTLPDPITDETVTTTQYEGNQNVMLTLFYSHCPNVCQQMIGQLRNVQADAIKNGYGGDVEFLAITFDPQRDTEKRLREYAREKRIALDNSNWHYLRPSSAERTKTVTDTFGIGLQRTYPDDGATGTPTNATTATESKRESSTYYFTHLGLVLLVNIDGYVERAYQFAQSGNPPWQDRRDDLKTLLDREK